MNEDIRIVILQRGWVMVGRFERKEDSHCTLKGASVIRVWGTTYGLGEIAAGGPTCLTILDPVGTVEFHDLTTIATIMCKADKWHSLCQ